MYVSREPGDLPVFYENGVLSTPADVALAKKLADEHTDQELEKRFEAAKAAFFRLDSKVRRWCRLLFLPVMLLVVILPFALIFLLQPPEDTFHWVVPLGGLVLVLFLVVQTDRAFTVEIERRTKDSLILAHTLRMALEMRRFRRWWKDSTFREDPEEEYEDPDDDPEILL